MTFSYNHKKAVIVLFMITSFLTLATGVRMSLSGSPVSGLPFILSHAILAILGCLLLYQHGLAAARYWFRKYVLTSAFYLAFAVCDIGLIVAFIYPPKDELSLEIRFSIFAAAFFFLFVIYYLTLITEFIQSFLGMIKRKKPDCDSR